MMYQYKHVTRKINGISSWREKKGVMTDVDPKPANC